MAIAIAAILAIIIIAVFVTKAAKYSRGVKALEQGKITKGYEILTSMKGYRNSAGKAEEVRVEYQKLKIKNAQKGDYITFGTYEQDNNLENGKEPIEWLVLDKKTTAWFL